MLEISEKYQALGTNIWNDGFLGNRSWLWNKRIYSKYKITSKYLLIIIYYIEIKIKKYYTVYMKLIVP